MDKVIQTGNTFEKYRTGSQLIFVIIAAVILVPIAIYAMTRKRVYDSKTQGTVLQVSNRSCEAECDTRYMYMVNNETFQGSAPGRNVSGKDIALFYNPQNPSDSGLAATEALTQSVNGTVLYREHKNTEHNKCREYTETKRVKTGKDQYDEKEITKYDCYITYKYTVKDKTYYKETKQYSTKNFQIGDTIDVFYESKNPLNSRFESDDYRAVGIGLSVIMSVLVVFLGVQFYLTSKVKGYGTFTLASRVARGKNVF